MADAIRPGGVYYVGGRLENGKLTGGRWLNANGDEVDAPSSGERRAALSAAQQAEQALREQTEAQRLAAATPVAVVEQPSRRGR